MLRCGRGERQCPAQAPALALPRVRGAARGALASIAAATCLAWTAAGQAQTPPPTVAPQVNPGLVTNQNERNRQQIEQQNALPQGPAVVTAPRAPTQIGKPGGPTFVVRDIVFDTSQFIAPQELDAIKARYVGTRVDITGLQRMVKEINDIYAAKGIVTAAAYLPPQKLQGGIVRIKFVEGRLGNLKVTGNNVLSPDFVRGRVSVKPGEVVDVPKVTDELAFFNKTGVARIQALLQPGAQFGLSDVELAVTEPPRNLLQFFVDNQGVPSVGTLEGGVLFQRYAPLGIDDRLTLYGVKSAGDISGTASYNVPFNPWGGRVGLSYTRGAIRVVSGPYESLHITGDSQVASVNLSQPVFVNSSWLFLVNGAVGHDISTSDQEDIDITGNHTTLATAGISLGYTGSVFSASVSPTVTRAFSHSTISMKNNDFDLQSGTFTSFLQLPLNFYGTFSGAWQVASKDLLPGDQLFQVGGATSVRGFETDIAAGATGYYTNLELHRSFSDLLSGFDGYVFFDHGAVYSSFPAEQQLSSAGLGFTWNISKYVTAEASAGFPINKIAEPQSDYELYFRLTAKIQ
jgi:hemolysin activation/secretion protein